MRCISRHSNAKRCMYKRRDRCKDRIFDGRYGCVNVNVQHPLAILYERRTMQVTQAATINRQTKGLNIESVGFGGSLLLFLQSCFLYVNRVLFNSGCYRLLSFASYVPQIERIRAAARLSQCRVYVLSETTFQNETNHLIQFCVPVKSFSFHRKNDDFIRCA